MNFNCKTKKKSVWFQVLASLLCTLILLSAMPMSIAYAADADVDGIYQTTAALNCRSGRGTGYSRIALIPKDVKLDVENIQNGWGCVTYNGQTGYVAMSYMKLIEAAQTAASGTYKTTAALNCRLGRGTQYAKVVLIPKGTILNVSNISNGWGYVTYNGKSGYIAMDYTTEVQSTSSSNTSSGSTSSSGTSSSTSSGSTSSSGTSSNTSSGATTDSKTGVYVTTAALNCRKGPATSYSRVALLPKGATVTVTAVTKDWGAITYNGVSGYVAMAYLKKVEESTSSNTSSNVSSNVSSNTGSSVSSNPSSDTVSNTSSNVSSNTSSNVSSNTSSSAGTTTETTVISGTGKTTAALNLRSGAATTYAKLLVIPKGATIKVISATGDWGKVTYNGTTGYVSMDFVTMTSTSTSTGSSDTSDKDNVTDTTTGKSASYRTTAALNLRKGPGTGYAKLLVIPKGTVLDVVVNGDWGKVTYNGQTGYVSMAYLQSSAGNYGDFAALQKKYPTGSFYTKDFTKGWYATGCYAFLLQIAYEWSGQVAPLAWDKITSQSVLTSLKPGDILCGTKHSIMITGVDGNKIQFVHSNWKYQKGNPDDIVYWDCWTTVGALQSGSYIGTLKYVLRKGN